MSDPTQHVVEPRGDRLTRIAAHYGYADADRVWSQNPDLAKKRKNREELAPGDVVILPPKITNTDHDLADESSASFVCPAYDPQHLRVTLVFDKAPIPDSDFELTVSDPRSCGPLTSDNQPGAIHGKTDKGVVDVLVHPLVTEAVLFLPTLGVALKLLLGALHPADTQSGIRQRLRNLGYFCPIPAPTDDAPAVARADLLTTHAVRRFQEDRYLAVTGRLDETSKARIARDHTMPAGTAAAATTTAPSSQGLPSAMRRYFVTTNTDIVIALPTLTVTARSAFFCPASVLSAKDVAGRLTHEGRGRMGAPVSRAARPIAGALPGPAGP